MVFTIRGSTVRAAQFTLDREDEMGFAKQSFVIVEGHDADTVSERVTEFLNAGYSLHGILQVAEYDGAEGQSVVYAQAVVKYGEQSYG